MLSAINQLGFRLAPLPSPLSPVSAFTDDDGKITRLYSGVGHRNQTNNNSNDATGAADLNIDDDARFRFGAFRVYVQVHTHTRIRTKVHNKRVERWRFIVAVA